MRESSSNPETTPETTEKKKMGPIEWFRNYGYYYKGWMTIGLIIVLVIGALLFMLRYDGADMRLIVVTQDDIDAEAFYNFSQKAEPFVFDVDGDNTPIPRYYRYVLSDEKAKLSEIPEKIASKEYLGFLVDDAGYAYIKTLCELRELSYFGIQSDADDPYRLTLTGTPILEETGMEGTNYYLVMKNIDNSSYNDVYTSGRTDILVGIGRNNDSDPDNDVTITKSSTSSAFSLFGR